MTAPPGAPCTVPAMAVLVVLVVADGPGADVGTPCAGADAADCTDIVVPVATPCPAGVAVVVPTCVIVEAGVAAAGAEVVLGIGVSIDL